MRHDVVVDLRAALEIIDEAIAAIDEFDVVYRKASDSEGATFRQFWDQSLEIEQGAVLPRLELARQIATHVGADELPISSRPTRRCTSRTLSKPTAPGWSSWERGSPNRNG